LLAAALAEELRRRNEHRLPGRRSALTDAELWVDADTWRRTMAQARELGKLLHDGARPPRSVGTVHVSATISLFVMDR
jgi:hypothetical protein